MTLNVNKETFIVVFELIHRLDLLRFNNKKMTRIEYFDVLHQLFGIKIKWLRNSVSRLKKSEKMKRNIMQLFSENVYQKYFLNNTDYQ